MKAFATILIASALAFGALAFGVAASAKAVPPQDSSATGPAGIVADPCPPHPPAQQPPALTRDFGQLCRYAADNRALHTRPRVVFLGDSITEGWIAADPSLFTRGLVDRGINGQTTPQMLVRFRSDVLALRPRAVHIMAGTNDIAGNTGAATIETVEGHIASMAELARAHGIKVILASIPPAIAFPWASDKRPAPQIAALNTWVRDYARRNGFTYVDYHAAMALPDGGMRPGLASDGVHPTPQGYATMRPLAIAAIDRALGK